MTNRKEGASRAILENVKKYAVTYLFIALSVCFIVVSGLDMSFVSSQLLLRLNRNAFIVLALIPGPQAVFLDELTTGLDARARRDVWSRLEALKAQGMTLLLTSHFMDEVEELCDRICILKKGVPVFAGTVEEAIAQSGCARFEDAYLMLSDEREEHA